MLLRSKHTILPLSVTAVSLAVLMHRVGAGYRWGNFLEGLFAGLAFSLGILSLIAGFRTRSHG